MRLFFAIEVPPELRKQVYFDFSQNPRYKSFPLRWTSMGNLHITLQFLGEVAEESVSRLVQGAESAFSGTNRQEAIKFERLGCFPNASAPKVFWLGAAKNPGLEALQRNLTRNLIADHFPADRKPFFPHLTLARVNGRDGARCNLSEICDHTEITYPPFTFRSVLLVKSDLHPRGPIYTILRDFMLE